MTHEEKKKMPLKIRRDLEAATHGQVKKYTLWALEELERAWAALEKISACFDTVDVSEVAREALD